MTLRSLWCLFVGHTDLLIVDHGVLYLRCGECGETSPGYQVPKVDKVIPISAHAKYSQHQRLGARAWPPQRSER